MTWQCDACGKTIESSEAGYVEWKSVTDGSPAGRRREGFRLVHNKQGCHYNERAFPQGTSLSDLPMDSFQGEDGLMTILEFMSDGPAALEELIELTKRLHIKGYEEARGWFQGAINEGEVEPNRKPGFYSAYDIQQTLKWAQQQKKR